MTDDLDLSRRLTAAIRAVPGVTGVYPSQPILEAAADALAVRFALRMPDVLVDIDRAEFNKVRVADVTLQSNVAAAIRALDEAGAMPQNLDVWWKEIRTWQERYPLVYDEPSADGPLRPQHVIEAIGGSC